MVNAPRKKSPRAPSLSLDDALDRAIKVYEHQRLHSAPTEVVAQHVGYKSANNGAALSALASLRYYGLLERPKEGLLAVTKNVENYKFTPDETVRRSLLIGFLKTPPLFNDLLEKYVSGLPSDPNLRYELIQRGFIPAAAESTLVTFKRSVEFASYYERMADADENDLVSNSNVVACPESSISQQVDAPGVLVSGRPQLAFSSQIELEGAAADRIPVRLPGARVAWLVIPTPFFDADKVRLKAQIDLLLTREDEPN